MIKSDYDEIKKVCLDITYLCQSSLPTKQVEETLNSFTETLQDVISNHNSRIMLGLRLQWVRY